MYNCQNIYISMAAVVSVSTMAMGRGCSKAARQGDDDGYAYIPGRFGLLGMLIRAPGRDGCAPSPLMLMQTALTVLIACTERLCVDRIP